MRIKVPREQVEALLERLIGEGEEIAEAVNHIPSAAGIEDWTHSAEKWDSLSRAALVSVFEGDVEAEEFHNAATGRIFRRVNQTDAQTLAWRAEAIRRGIHILQSLGQRLEFAEGPAPQQQPAVSSAQVGEELPKFERGSPRVFVVHGRDAGRLAQVQLALTKLGLQPVVLSEQAHQGKTLVEKFETHARGVGFAVVLLAAEDRGAGPGDDVPADPNRARQNVILELGYLMGSLGREYVVALYDEDADMPSDLNGLGYVPFDTAGLWRYRLVTEMNAAGYDLSRDALDS